jgi:16S rRNA processing protein RimM
MIPANCILLGKITRVHGFGGAVTVKTEIDLSENIPQGEPVFLLFQGRPVPFFIEDTHSSRPGIINLKFEDYNSSEKVKEFVGCRVFIRGNPATDKKDEDLSDLIGYTVLSGSGDSVGIINEVIPNPGQVLLELTSVEGKKLLIPLHEDLVRSINRDTKTITMIIPYGLTEIN